MNRTTPDSSLWAAAREDAPPTVDVAGRVINSLAAPPAPTRGLMWAFAGISAAAAAILAVLAARTWLAEQDSFPELFQTVMAVMQ
jgi:hypothetical protein